MKKIIYYMILTMMGTLIASQSNAQELKENSLLWQISGNSLKNDSYIVLTTPSLCVESNSLMGKMEDILDKVKAYYTETGINNPNTAAETEKMLRINDSKSAINKILTSKAYMRVRAKLSKINVNEETLNSYKPIYAYNVLSKAVYPECNHANYTEFLFRAYAEQYNIPVKELLSIKDAVSIIDAYGNDYWSNEIDYVLNNEQEIKNILASKAEFYYNEDIQGINSLYIRTRFLNSRYEHADIERLRTDLLVKSIIGAITRESSVITFDIACVMNQSTSVFKRLELLGYKVTPVK
ncbi:TraB/GumN family protein [Sphingobacterium cellulitidis]|uniref:TraB/GumN family protein n=1 Tax=Sphingobacterium cellulitidis TaxID=1768011 RepID=UPI003C7A8B01